MTLNQGNNWPDTGLASFQSSAKLQAVTLAVLPPDLGSIGLIGNRLGTPIGPRGI